MPWCFIESSQNGTLPDAVPGPRVFEHEVPCPKVVGAKSTKRQKTRRVLDNIMTVIKERLKSISNEEKDEDNLENTKECRSYRSKDSVTGQDRVLRQRSLEQDENITRHIQ
jgi:hypothetical protein